MEVFMGCDLGNGPSGSIEGGKFLDGLVPISFSRTTLLHGVNR